MVTRRLASCALLLTALAASGCGDGGGSRVSGTVTFNGKPVRSGRVYFDPDGASNPQGTQGFADIKDGSYDTGSGGRNPTPGAVVVRIEGLGEPTTAYPGGKPLFNEHREKFTVPQGKSTKDFVVPNDGQTKVPDNPGPPP